MSYNLVDPTTGDLTRVAGGNSINDETTSTNTTWSSEKINDSLDGKADKNAVLNSLEVVNGNVTAQIIPWDDGTHYRGFEDKSNNTCTDIITKDGIAKIARTENGALTKLEELATMDKVNNIPLIYNQNTDILAYALTCPQEKRTLVRIYSANATNNPYGVSTDTDFIYEIDKINFNDLFITVRAKDTKTNREFINTKNETKWLGWQELATMDKVVNSIIREGKSVLYNLNNVNNIEVAIDIAKSGYKPIAVSLYNAGTHLWFAQGMYFNDTVCNLSLRGVAPSSATNAKCEVLVTYIKTS